MFCPKCGEKLSERDDHLYCVRGDMYLSEFVSTRFQDYFIDKKPPANDKPYPFPIGGTWFCPADATRMVENDCRVTCPCCAVSFTDELIYQLIERHPHAPKGKR